MADTSRFPPLVPPFAVVGAVAGWLSANLSGQVSRPLTAACAAVVAAATGALLKRLCVGRRYQYELGDPDPELRPATDAWALHVAVVLAAGAVSGALVAGLTPHCTTDAQCALAGALSAVVFVPVCLAVVAAARRAQRARLGSVVADSDRRAVWGIMAITLGVTTVEGLPEWPLAMAGYGTVPMVALAVLVGTGAVTLGIRLADARSLRWARGEIDAGLSARGPADPEPDDGDAARLDLGLGEGLLARVARGAAAYRQRERTVALVRGSPELTLEALRGSVRRGTIGLVVLFAVGVAHAAAALTPAALTYEIRCTAGDATACIVAAALTRRP
jgi:hypothetical protein